MALRELLPATALFVFLTSTASGEGPPAPLPPPHTPPPAVAPQGSLYARLGGTATVTAFVGETIDRISTDPATNQSFDKVNVQRVKDMIVEQICSLTGGGCTYTGDTMKDTHAGHHITNADFMMTVEVLRAAMRRHDVPLSARNELLEILAPMKRETVKL
jgi:hemoglobin